MKKIIFIFLYFCFFSEFKSQNNCDVDFIKDTLFIANENKVLNGEYLTATLKNGSVVQFFKVNVTRFFLKLIINKNTYFDKVDVLEIKSGKKSYYEKNIKQFKLDKTTGMYVLEIFENYLITLKNEGISAIVFNETETEFTNQDVNKIKKIATCFYQNVILKK